jgi:predicted tellurium resistance membrane protein TerC
MESIGALLADPSAWVALVTLIVMEVVLGIDNLIFIAILTNRLPEQHRLHARRIGIGAALLLRLLLLATVATIVTLTTPVVTLLGRGFSWRDIILLAGGLFLVWKATQEIHHRVEPGLQGGLQPTVGLEISFAAAISQIVLLDLVFSIDSIITAVGMTQDIPIMVAAVVIAVLLMLVAATPLASFVNAHPTVVMLALAFLLMIGMVLIAEAFGVHVPKGYIYAAMVFAALVEALNMLARRRGGGDGGGQH